MNRKLDHHVDGVQLEIPPGAEGFEFRDNQWLFMIIGLDDEWKRNTQINID